MDNKEILETIKNEEGNNEFEKRNMRLYSLVAVLFVPAISICYFFVSMFTWRILKFDCLFFPSLLVSLVDFVEYKVMKKKRSLLFGIFFLLVAIFFLILDIGVMQL